MKNFYIVVLMLCTIPSAMAEICVALEYQELKEMKIDDLVTEYCAIKQKTDFGKLSIDISMDLFKMDRAMGSVTERKSAALDEKINAQTKCTAQQSRLGRVLETKGHDETNLAELCQKIQEQKSAAK